MKKLAVLSFLISSSAFAHQTMFDDPFFLKLSKGDPVAAQELSTYCSGTGKDPLDCRESLLEGGSLKQQAARKCITKMHATSFTYRINNEAEIPGSRGHAILGTTWHSDYRKDADGEHRHVFTEADKQRARAEAEQRQGSIEVDRVIRNNGTKTFTGGSEMGGGLQVGTGSVSPVNVQVTFEGKGTNSTTTTPGLLDEAARKRVIEAGNAAYKDPNLTSVKPSVGCIKSEVFCITGDGSKVKNESYEPKKENKDDKDNKDHQSTNNTPPKHEKDSNEPNFHEDTHGNNSWAGTGDDDTSPSDGTMIATPLDSELMAKSPLESCTETEFKNLEDSIGSQTTDPDAMERDEDRKQRAETMLVGGYCDESFYGREACQAHKNKANSVLIKN